MPRALGALGLALLCTLAPSASAQTMPALAPAAEVAPLLRLRVDPWATGIVTGSAWSYWLVTELLRPELASRWCRWCDRDASGRDTLNAFDADVRRGLRWDDTKAANTLGDLGAGLVTPLVTVGTLALFEHRDEGLAHFAEDALVIAEAAGVALAASQMVKYSVARARPYAHARAGGELVPGYGAEPVPDDNLSFYSAHATFTFALATATGTVASMRGLRGAGWIWAGGLTAASVTSYLRIAADRHYATDVLSAAALGSAIGFAFPYFLHRPGSPLTRANVHASAAPAPGGGTVFVSGVF